MEQLPKIVRERLRAAAAHAAHPDPDLLAAFTENALNERQRGEVLEHLAQCAECREAVSLSLAPEEMVVPEMAAAAEAAFAPVAAPALASRRLGWPVMRWGALAACAVIVAAAVLLRYRTYDKVAPYTASTSASPAASMSQQRGTTLPEREKLEPKSAPPSTPLKQEYSLTTDRLAKRQAMSQDKANAAKTEEGRIGRELGTRLAMVAPAPPPPSAEALNQVANAEKDSRKEQAPSAAAETVTVEAAAPGPALADAESWSSRADADAKAASPARTKSQIQAESAAGSVVGGPVSQRSDQTLFRAAAVFAPRWTISPEGNVQRSLDNGQSWEKASVGGEGPFRALSVLGADIWVGGAKGALYHSPDAGQHWTELKPVANGTPLSADIVRIDFTDLQHGTLVTANKETWSTTDAGKSWQKK
ncbi:MAG TPA: zf-HC2 domain-containing protein [Terriglobales bacterium]|jgi:hypothetical protein